jgi:hypothetical protein
MLRIHRFLLGYREQALFMEWPKDYAHRAGPQINVCASQSPDPWPPKPDDSRRPVIIGRQAMGSSAPFAV